MKPNPQQLLNRLSLSLLVLLATCTLISRLGFLHWLADLFSLFHASYLWCTVLVFTLLLALRNWRWASLALLVVVINAYLVVPFFLPSVRAENVELRLMVHNIYYQNPQLDNVVKAIEEANPDVIFLMEYSFTIADQIEQAFASYPFRLLEPRRYTTGLALFSKFPLVSPQVHHSASRIPIFSTSIQLRDDQLSFVGGHPLPPMGRWGQLHREQVKAISHIAASATHPLIVAGDFNASPWSYAIYQLQKDAQLDNARHGFGFSHTWHLNPYIGLPLDHIFASEEIAIIKFSQGPKSGSDHNALILDMGF